MTNAAPSDAMHHLSASEKVVAVLMSFEGVELPQGVSDVAAFTGVSVPTVHRILRTLADAGLLVQLPDRRYEPTIRLFSLGASASREIDMRHIALPKLFSLQRHLGDTVTFGVLSADQNSVVLLERLPSLRKPPIARLGLRYSLHCASIGKVLLAFSTRLDIERYVGAGLVPCTERSISDPNELLDHLAQIRRKGYGTCAAEAVDGQFGVAAPVLDSHGVAIAAVCAASTDLGILEMADPVVATARAIAADLTLSRQGEAVVTLS